MHTFFPSSFVLSHLSTIVIQQVAGPAVAVEQSTLSFSRTPKRSEKQEISPCAPACSKRTNRYSYQSQTAPGQSATGHPPSSILAQTSACTSASASAGVDTISGDSAKILLGIAPPMDPPYSSPACVDCCCRRRRACCAYRKRLCFPRQHCCHRWRRAAGQWCHAARRVAS